MKLYGYNINGKPVLLPVNRHGMKSSGQYAFGEENGKYFIIYRSGIKKDYELAFGERVTKDKTYLPFDFDPFTKSPEEWEQISLDLQK